MKLITPPGELGKRARQKNILNDALKLSDRDDLADVEIITLKQWAKEQAYATAWNRVKTPMEIELEAYEIMETNYTISKEFVKVKTNHIQVGLNVDEVDDRAVYKAIALMVQVEDLTTENTHEFGEDLFIET